MDRFYVFEASEVLCVEGQDAFHAVDMHGGGDSGIVDLDSGDGVSNEELAPYEMHSGVVGEHRDLVFNDPRPPISLRGRQAEAVTIQRPCQNVPKLAEILRGVAGKGARTNKRITARSTSGCKGSPDSSQRIRMLLSSSMRMAGLWVIAVDAFAGQGGVRKVRQVL